MNLTFQWKSVYCSSMKSVGSKNKTVFRVTTLCFSSWNPSGWGFFPPLLTDKYIMLKLKMITAGVGVRFSQGIGDLCVLVKWWTLRSQLISLWVWADAKQLCGQPCSLSLCCCPVCLQSMGCCWPEKAFFWPGLKAPLWVNNSSCPPFIILTTASSPAQASLSHRTKWPEPEKKTFAGHSLDRKLTQVNIAGKGIGLWMCQLRTTLLN